MIDVTDVPENKWEEILDYFNEPIPTDEEIWDIARENEDIPNFSNIYLELLFTALENAIKANCKSDDLEISYHENNLASKFVVDDCNIWNLDDLKSVLDI